MPESVTAGGRVGWRGLPGSVSPATTDGGAGVLAAGGGGFGEIVDGSWREEWGLTTNGHEFSRMGRGQGRWRGSLVSGRGILGEIED